MILVAGATGRLGSRLVRRLAERGVPVRILTRDVARAGHLAEFHPEIVCGDLREEASVRRAARGVDVIVAAAHGFAGTDGSTPDTVDRMGNRHLVAAAEETGAAVVLMSVVGAAPNHSLALFRAKHAAELHLWERGIPATVIRATAFVETWAMILGEPLAARGRGLVFGRGVNPINFVSVGAVAALLERAVLDTSLQSRTLEIGGPDNLTLGEFVALLAERMGIAGGEMRHVPLPVLRAMAVLLRPVAPAFAAKAAAAVAMDTLDMTFDTSALCAEFPELPNPDVRAALAACSATAPSRSASA
jgi:uncharacterized protein YbjT (DUF2867 family)